MMYRAMLQRLPSLDGTGLYIIRSSGVGNAEYLARDGQWIPYEEYAQIPETLFLPRDADKALVTAVLSDKYGALPHDQLLRDRLDIETNRVDKLLEVITREQV